MPVALRAPGGTGLVDGHVEAFRRRSPFRLARGAATAFLPLRPAAGGHVVAFLVVLAEPLELRQQAVSHGIGRAGLGLVPQCIAAAWVGVKRYLGFGQQAVVHAGVFQVIKRRLGRSLSAGAGINAWLCVYRPKAAFVPSLAPKVVQ